MESLSLSRQAGKLESLFRQAGKLESALQLQKGLFAVESSAAVWKFIAVFIAGITVITAITVQAIVGGTLRLLLLLAHGSVPPVM